MKKRMKKKNEKNMKTTINYKHGRTNKVNRSGQDENWVMCGHW